MTVHELMKMVQIEVDEIVREEGTTFVHKREMLFGVSRLASKVLLNITNRDYSDLFWKAENAIDDLCHDLYASGY